MISRFYYGVTECHHLELINETLTQPGRTLTKCQGTGACCTQASVKLLYRSQMPMTLSRKQLDGTPYGLFLAALEREDKECLFDCMAHLEDSLEKILQILRGRSASNARWLSTLQHFAESYGLRLPSEWIREYRRNRRNKSLSKV